MKRYALILTVVYLALYILPLGVRPVALSDEARYGEIPREMLASGDWVVPKLNGLMYFEKPVMGYWLNALSIQAFGENGFAIRLPSALAVGLSALLLILLLRRSRHSPRSALWTSAIFLSFLWVFVIGVSCVLDTVFSFFLTAGFVFYYLAWQSAQTRVRWSWLAACGAAFGGAFLVKGFLALALPVVVIGAFLVWERQWARMFKDVWLPLLVMVLVVLPWGVLVHQRAPDYWNYFFWVEHIQRFLSPAGKNHHEEPFWYFLPILLIGAAPWVAVFPAAAIGLRGLFRQSLTRYAACWFVMQFLFFSASRGKLSTYILPCFSPLAVLLALGLLNYFRQGWRQAFDRGALLLAWLSGVGVLVALGTWVAGSPGFGEYQPGELWKLFGGVLVAVIWGVTVCFAARAPDFRKKIMLFSAAPLALLFSIHFILPNEARPVMSAQKFLLRHQADVPPGGILFSDSAIVHSVCWIYKRTDVRLLRSPGELEYGLKQSGDPQRLLNLKQFAQLVKNHTGAEPITLIVEANDYESYKKDLPPAAHVNIELADGLALIQYHR